MSKKVVIIGAGVAGLACARYASQAGHDVTVYEQNSKVGGTWLYTDRTDKDEYGIEINSSMYKGLRTNLPKEVMCLGDYSIKTEMEESFIPCETILDSLEALANQFDLKKLVKFTHYVVRVHPVKGDRWEVTVKDLLNDMVSTHYYDAIFICNGQYTMPSLPSLPGMDKFQGVQQHSHEYRDPEHYKGKDVLVMGSGASGVDLAYTIPKYANRVYFSYPEHNPNHRLPHNVELKGSVKEFTETGAIFVDGSERNFTNVIYCTGYKYSFPQLSEDCGICVENNFVKPLYRQCINIKYPSMYFIGIPTVTLAFPIRDIQARYCMKYLNGEKKLPSAEEMQRQTDVEIEEKRRLGIMQKKYHYLNSTHQQYSKQLSEEADIEDIPDIIHRIYIDASRLRQDHPFTFRSVGYKILDNGGFLRVEPDRRKA